MSTNMSCGEEILGFFFKVTKLIAPLIKEKNLEMYKRRVP